MQHLIYTFVLAISIAYSVYGAQKAWPCIAGQCPDQSQCGAGPYGCDPPTCTRDEPRSEECARLPCSGGRCGENFPKRALSGSCGSHAACSVDHLCENDVCTRVTRAGSFEICDKDEDCRLDPQNQNTECLKYVPGQQFAGVCLLKSRDPANTPPTPPPNGPNADQSRDRATNCEQHRNLCTNQFYQNLMKENCAQTCRDAGNDLRCIDKHPNCANWVSNGFCDEGFYSTEQKRERCQKSCNLC